MQRWKMRLEYGGKQLGEVPIRWGIFQRDSLSPPMPLMAMISNDLHTAENATSICPKPRVNAITCCMCMIRSCMCMIRSCMCMIRSCMCMIRSCMCMIRSCMCMIRSCMCMIRSCMQRMKMK